MEQQFVAYLIEVLVSPWLPPAGSFTPWMHPHVRASRVAGGRQPEKDSTLPSRKTGKPGTLERL